MPSVAEHIGGRHIFGAWRSLDIRRHACDMGTNAEHVYTGKLPLRLLSLELISLHT